MPKFLDNAGRAWSLAITVASARRVRELVGVDFMECLVPEDSLLDRLAADPVLLCDVLFAVVEPKARTDGVSSESFGEALAGDAIDAATTALLEALVDFFPSGKRILLKKTLAIRSQIEARVQEGVEENLAMITESQIDAVVKKLFLQPGELSATAPE